MLLCQRNVTCCLTPSKFRTTSGKYCTQLQTIIISKNCYNFLKASRSSIQPYYTNHKQKSDSLFFAPTCIPSRLERTEEMKLNEPRRWKLERPNFWQQTKHVNLYSAFKGENRVLRYLIYRALLSLFVDSTLALSDSF